MDSNSFIGRLSMQSGLPAEEIAKRLDTLTSIIKNYCQELDAVAVPGFGTFTPIKKDECIETTATGKKNTAASLHYSQFQVKRSTKKISWKMNAKIPLKKFAETFGNTQSVPYSESETFIKSVFETISEELKAGESVKINGLGTFRLSSTSDDPVIFTPDASFAAEINAPFAMFSPVELAEDLPDNAFEEIETETPPVAQESVEETPVAATEQESVDVRSDSTIVTEQNIEENQPEETAEIITDTDNKSVIDTDIRQDSEEIPASECTCTVPLGQTLPQENIAGTELPVNTEQPAADRDEKNIPAPAASAIKDWEYEEEEYVTPPDAEQPKGKFGNGFLAGLIVGLAIGALALCLYILYYVNIPADSDSADTDIEQVENAGTTAYM